MPFTVPICDLVLLTRVPGTLRRPKISHFFFSKSKNIKIRCFLIILGPHRFRNVREAISCNFVLLSSNMHLVAPRKNEKTVLKNSLVDNFGQSYLWATDRRTCFQRHKQEKQDELKYQFCEVEFSNFDRPDAENAQF